MADDKNKRTHYKPSEITFNEIAPLNPEALKRMNEIASKYVDDMLRGDMYRMFTPDPGRVPPKYTNDDALIEDMIKHNGVEQTETLWFLHDQVKPAPPDGKGAIIDISPVLDPPKELL